MDTLQAVREMLTASGLSPYRVAVKIGRHSSYVSQMLRRGSVPSADLLALMAGACGWRLALLPPDGSGLVPLTIDGGPAGADGSGGSAAAGAGAPPADG